MFILNGMVFLIIGLELPEIVDDMRTAGIPLKTAIGYGVLVTLLLVLVRIVSSYIAMFATLIFRPKAAPQAVSTKWRYIMPLFLGWTGMRGVVSLAAALAIPITLSNGEAFPYRNLILFITFIAILLTLLVQGLTLPFFINRTRFFEGLIENENEEETRRKMKQGLKKHVYEFMKDKFKNDLNGNAGLEKFLKQWEERTEAADDSWMNERTKEIFVEILEIQRMYLSELNKDPEINEEIIRQQLYQIDLEEERLKII